MLPLKELISQEWSQIQSSTLILLFASIVGALFLLTLYSDVMFQLMASSLPKCFTSLNKNCIRDKIVAIFHIEM